MTSRKQEIRCPYCSHTNAADAKACAGCGEHFPWTSEIDRLDAEIKSRETNRVRATISLVEDMFSSISEKRMISAPIVKGFISSWMMPRIAIVAGSLVGGLILLAQTYILWNQVSLQNRQTWAAEVEQEAALQDRLGKYFIVHSEIQRAATAFASASQFGRNEIIGFADVPAITSARSDAFINEDAGFEQLKVIRTVQSVSRIIQQSWGQIESVSGTSAEIDPALIGMGAFAQIRNSVIVPAIVHCGISTVQGSLVLQKINSLTAYQQKFRGLPYYDDSSDDVSIHPIDYLQYVKNLEEIANQARIFGNFDAQRDYYLRDLATFFLDALADLHSDLSVAADACQEKITSTRQRIDSVTHELRSRLR